MNDAQIKVLLQGLVETYNKNEEYLSINTPLKDDTKIKIDELVAYIKENY